MKGKILLIIGILLLLIATIGGGSLTYLAFQPLTKDPQEEAKYIIETPETVSIEEGQYDIWLETKGTGWWDIDIDVTDRDGDKIPIEKSNGDTKLRNQEFVLYGTIEFPDNGPFNITSNSDQEIYLTPPLKVGENFFICCGTMMCSIFILIIGILLAIIGLVMTLKSRN